MTYAIIGESTSISLATRFLADDPDGLANVFLIVDTFANQPRPPGVFAMGGSGMYRVRIGRYCIVYEIDEAARAIGSASRPRGMTLATCCDVAPVDARSVGSRRARDGRHGVERPAAEGVDEQVVVASGPGGVGLAELDQVVR